jgi:hypothetical protein
MSDDAEREGGGYRLRRGILVALWQSYRTGTTSAWVPFLVVR